MKFDRPALDHNAVRHVSFRTLVYGLLIALCTIAIDQFSKWYLMEIVHIGTRSPLEITSFFKLVMVWNPGISFGMFQQVKHGPQVLTALAVVIVLALLGWLLKKPAKVEVWGIGLVIGGALGNIIDRLRFEAVADFFYFYYHDFAWPAFNLADSAICLGAFMLTIYALSSPGKNAKSMHHETPPV